jgi:hypothetical protein
MSSGGDVFVTIAVISSDREGGAMIRLTRNDWAEIYYALETKSLALRQGKYGSENKSRADAEWIAHLEDLKRAIGPDGTTAAQRGIARSN